MNETIRSLLLVLVFYGMSFYLIVLYINPRNKKETKKKKSENYFSLSGDVD